MTQNVVSDCDPESNVYSDSPDDREHEVFNNQSLLPRSLDASMDEPTDIHDISLGSNFDDDPQAHLDAVVVGSPMVFTSKTRCKTAYERYEVDNPDIMLIEGRRYCIYL